MDRWDWIEFAGIALLVAFAAVTWWPAALAVAGIALIVEAQLRSLTPAAAQDDIDDGGDGS